MCESQSITCFLSTKKPIFKNTLCAQTESKIVHILLYSVQQESTLWPVNN